MACVPTTNTSCVIMTASAGGSLCHHSAKGKHVLIVIVTIGNTAAALFNAVVGNSIGVVVTPVLLLIFGALPGSFDINS